MPRIESRYLVLVIAAILGMWVVLGHSQAAVANISYRGLWETRENNGGRILQLYDHLVTVTDGQSLSDRLSASEKVSYNYRYEQEGLPRETVSPGASLSLSSDIFLANLAVNSVKNLRDQSNIPDSDEIGITWSSQWHKRLVPELRANYDYSRRRNDYINRLIDENRQMYGGEVSWDLLMANAFYSYRRDDTTNRGYQTIQDSHMARINAGHSWLANRLNVSLGHEYSETSNERLIPVTSANTAVVPLTLSDVRTGTDPTPGDVDDTMLVATASMRDGNLTLPAYSVAAATTNNSILVVTNGQPVDRIYIYVDDLTQSNLGAVPLGLSWEVYSNDILGTSWNPETTVPVIYDAVNQRFEVALPALNAIYLKFVLDWTGVFNINFTEVQAEQVLSAIAGSTASLVNETVINKSHFNFDFKVSKEVAFFYNLLMDKEENNAVTMNERENHVGGLRLQNAPGDLKSILTYSLLRSRYVQNPELQTEIYQLNVTKVFLPTLSMGIGAAHEEATQSGEAVYDKNRYNFYADAKLYPDLNSKLEATYWDQETYQAGGASNLWDNLRAEFTLTSRFRPSLNVTFFNVYEEQNLDKALVKEQNTTGLAAGWQISDLLSLGGSFQKEDNRLVPDIYIYTAAMVVGLSTGFQFKANYTLNDSTIRSQSGQAALLWSSRKNISWEVGCNYADNDGGTVNNVYKLYSKLLLNFATR